jgi:hypothetical protein
MKVNGRKAKSMVEVITSLIMEKVMTVIFRKARDRVKVYIHGLIKVIIRVSGSTTKLMGGGSIICLMVILSTDILKMTSL